MAVLTIGGPFAFDWGGISFPSGLRLIKFIMLCALSFHRELTGCPFAEFCACSSVRSIAGSQIRKIAHCDWRSAEVQKYFAFIWVAGLWCFVGDLDYLVWKFFGMSDWLSAHSGMWTLSCRAIRLCPYTHKGVGLTKTDSPTLRVSGIRTKGGSSPQTGEGWSLNLDRHYSWPKLLTGGWNLPLWISKYGRTFCRG